MQLGMKTRRGRYASLGAAVFALEAVFAVVHLATLGRYPHFEHWPHDPIVDSLLLAAWLAGALGFAQRWVFACAIGAIASLAHALYFSLSMQYVGIPFFVALALQIACIVKVWQAPPQGMRTSQA